jgi:hypothetical protein
MSDIQEADSQVEVETPVQDNKPAGYGPVDLSNLPDEVREPLENRINYLYSQVKTNERTLGQYKSIAQQQSEKLNELMGGFDKVVDHLYTQEQGQTEAQIRQEVKDAYASGDEEKYHAAQEKLTSFIVDRKLKSKPSPKQEAKPEIQRQPTVAELRAQGLNEGDWTQEDDTYLESWQSEMSNGRELRPWAKEGHPMYPYAYNESMLVFSSPAFEKLTTEQKLQEVDRRMGVSKSTGGQNVMGGNLTTRGKSSKITLTPKQQEIAVRTKFGSKDGAKSDADYIAHYAKQIATLNKKGR